MCLLLKSVKKSHKADTPPQHQGQCGPTQDSAFKLALTQSQEHTQIVSPGAHCLPGCPLLFKELQASMNRREKCFGVLRPFPVFVLELCHKDPSREYVVHLNLQCFHYGIPRVQHS